MDFISVIFMAFLPALLLIAGIAILKWLHIIKQNSEEQVKQNQEIISLLQQVKNNE